jgi:uncharacterized protein (TIGR00369 family)
MGPQNHNSSRPTTTPLEIPAGFRQLVGYKIDSWRDGEAVVSITIGPRHLNRAGGVHGGVISALIDAAGSQAGCYTPIEGNTRYCATLALSVQFIAPVTRGRLVARGIVHPTGRKLFHAAVEMRDGEDRLIATGQATYKYRPGSENPAGVKLERRPDKRGTTLG